MTPERYDRALALFLEARVLDAPSRSSFLSASCRDDPSLVAEVESLLAHDDPSSALLAGGAGSGTLARARLFCPEDPRPPAPQRLGKYTILGVLGQGGMGVVYRAAQEDPRRVVALKVIRPGWATPAAVRRFAHESAALARLHHPGIAQIYETGTFEDDRTGPQPYFAMELAEGLPLTGFAGARRLGTRQRLALVAEVCRAVHHAHQRGIIHRDLKPANIVVDEEGRPRVLDFGVARLADAPGATLRTESGALVGTLSYMSPEQASGDPEEVDTRSDVYSLGVIAYELLAGRRPHDFSNVPLPEAVRAIHQREPARLGTLDRALRGDVETIVAKAMEKDPARRYQSAAELAEDLGRYLRVEPIAARPASVWYQVSRFSRRNRALVGAAVAGLAVLLAGLGISLYAFAKARSERDQKDRALQLALENEGKAREEAGRARAAEASERVRADELDSVSRFQAAQLQDIDPRAMGQRLGRDVVSAVAAGLGASGVGAEEAAQKRAQLEALLARGNLTDVALRTLQETVFDRALAAVEGQFADQPLVKARLLQSTSMTLVALGLLKPAVAPQTEALAIRRSALGDRHPDTLASVAGLGGLLQRRGKLAEAEPLMREAADGLARVLGEDDPLTITASSNLGILLRDLGRLPEAEPYYRDALERRRRVLGADHPDTLNSADNMGRLLAARGTPAEAQPYYREALEGRRRVLGDEHPDTVESIAHMGSMLYDQGKYAEAEPYWREALEKRRSLLGSEHPKTIDVVSSMAHVLEALGRYGEAEPYACEALENRRRTLGDDHPLTLDSISATAVLLHKQGRLREAESLYREALERSRRTRGEDHVLTVSAIAGLGAVLHSQGQTDEAEPYLREALQTCRRTLGDEHPRTLQLISNLGAALLKVRRLSEAEPLILEAFQTRRRVLGEEHPRTLLSLNAVGGLLQAQGRLDEAESCFREALEKRRKAQGDAHPDTLVSCNTLGALLMLRGRLDEAEAVLIPAVSIAQEKLPARHEARMVLTRSVVALYEARDKAEPGKGHGAQAAHWRARLEPP